MESRIDEIFKIKGTNEILIVINYCEKTKLFSLQKQNNEILTINELPEIPKQRKHFRVNEIHNSTKSGEIKIIEYYSSMNVTIKFLNDNTIIFNMQYSNVKKGTLMNPNDKTLCNIGYIGQGIYNTRNYYKEYNIWNKMIQRCYDEKVQSNHPSYIGCTVDERWYNFQIFAEWCINNYINEFHLDKDILFTGNKIYSQETCCFVPREINNLFIKPTNNEYLGASQVSSNSYRVRLNKNKTRIDFGCYQFLSEALYVYKIEKEKYIKEVAEIWKDKITEKVYQALINYQIEITN